MNGMSRCCILQLCIMRVLLLLPLQNWGNLSSGTVHGLPLSLQSALHSFASSMGS